MTEKPTDEVNAIARVLGQAFMRHQHMQANPDQPKDQLREALRQEWVANRRDYTKLGRMVARHLQTQGFVIAKTAAAPAVDIGMEDD